MSARSTSTRFVLSNDSVPNNGHGTKMHGNRTRRRFFGGPSWPSPKAQPGAAGQLPGPWETFSRASLGLGGLALGGQANGSRVGNGLVGIFLQWPPRTGRSGFQGMLIEFRVVRGGHRVSSHPTSDSPKGRPLNRTRGSLQHGGGVDRDGGPSSFISAARAQQTRVIGCRLSRLRRGGGASHALSD